VAEGNAQLAGLVWSRLDADGAAPFVYQGFQPVGEPEPLRPNSTLRAQTMRLDVSAPTPKA